MKRNSSVVLVLCACFISVGWGQQPAGTVHTNWSEFHRPNMIRWNPYENVLSVNNVGRLHRKWSHLTGYYVDSSPAIVNGVVYVDSNDGYLYALKASTGAKLWRATFFGGTAGCSPAVANGVVYVGANVKLYALNANTGAKLWSYTMGFVISSPTVVNGVVYVGSWDNKVYALNARTGAKLWSYTTGDHVESSPAVANGVVYVGSWDHKVYAFDLKRGLP
jgi:outer membrane protein assembly factor BamB